VQLDGQSPERALQPVPPAGRQLAGERRGSVVQPTIVEDLAALTDLRGERTRGLGDLL
jgi:hypothetical protein